MTDLTSTLLNSNTSTNSGRHPPEFSKARSGTNFLAMLSSQVRAPPSGYRRGIVPFEPHRVAQQGQVSRPLHWKSHGQIKLSLMLICVLVVYYLLVRSLSVFAGRGEHTRCLGVSEGVNTHAK